MGINLFSCWPGLAALWYRGLPRGLLLAVLFCWLVCLLLLATFLWPLWLNTWIVKLGWVLIFVGWFASTIHSHWTLSTLLGNPNEQAHKAFVQAQQEYLRGNWFESEAILLNLLNRYPRDAEALLLLVGVLRHTKRWQPAIRRLEQLKLLDTSAPWSFEIHREEELIQARRAESESAEQ